MKTILLTGVTGIVGSHVLYELLEEIVFDQKDYRIYLLVRTKKGVSGFDRVQQEVLCDELLPLRLRGVDMDEVMGRLHVIEGNMESCMFPASLGREIEVFHVAASVNLGTTESSFMDVYQNNYQATRLLLNKLEGRIRKFNFVSTAFSSGDRSTRIEDDYHNLEKCQYRNPYERYKHKIESELLELSQNGEFKCSIIRPSVVCGRLLKEPHFVMNRYIVFYMIGSFLKKMTEKYGPIERFRILANPKGGLNIVPVDYVAKGILRAANSETDQVNITLSENVPNEMWISHIMNKEGVRKFEFVDTVPKDMTPIERIYYKTVGAQITGYLHTSAHSFASDNVRKIMQDITEPKVAETFRSLYDYAHERNFRMAA